MSVETRLYRDEDEEGVAETLQAAFGRWPGDIDVPDPRAYFRWKHLESPFGRSLLVVAEDDGAVVGVAGWMPCVFTASGRRYEALRGVDLAVRPECRGQGVAGAIATAGTHQFPSGISFSLSNPNPLSKGTVTRQGRSSVGRFPTFVRVRRPLRTALGRRAPRADKHAPPPVDAEDAATALADEGLAPLLAEIDWPGDRLMVAKSSDYLRWRYGSLGLYRAIRAEDGASLRGVCIFRIRRHGATWNTRICELLVAGRDGETARRLLRRAVRAAPVDYAACHFPSGTVQRRSAIRCGFVRSRHGETVMAYKIDPSMPLDPTDSGSWAPTLGDLDLL